MEEGVRTVTVTATAVAAQGRVNTRGSWEHEIAYAHDHPSSKYWRYTPVEASHSR